MMKNVLTVPSLSATVGLALALMAMPGHSQTKTEMAKMPKAVQDNMMKMTQNKLEKCYGINTVAKNDCAEGTHSCAGQSTQARDMKSFVMLPTGDCTKIQGGKLQAS